MGQMGQAGQAGQDGTGAGQDDGTEKRARIADIPGNGGRVIKAALKLFVQEAIGGKTGLSREQELASAAELWELGYLRIGCVEGEGGGLCVEPCLPEDAPQLHRGPRGSKAKEVLPFAWDDPDWQSAILRRADVPVAMYDEDYQLVLRIKVEGGPDAVARFHIADVRDEIIRRLAFVADCHARWQCDPSAASVEEHAFSIFRGQLRRCRMCGVANEVIGEAVEPPGTEERVAP
jgi:hypothetical protein